MENKTSKYFKYAIGEIILVVIGILIALQINNYNDAQKEKNELKEYLAKISNNIEKDILILDSIKAKRVAINKICAKALKGYMQNEFDLNLVFSSAEAFVDTYFTPNASGYEALKNSTYLGKINGTQVDGLLDDYNNLINGLLKEEQSFYGYIESMESQWTSKFDPTMIFKTYMLGDEERDVLVQDPEFLKSKMYKEIKVAFSDNIFKAVIARVAAQTQMLKDYDRIIEKGKKTVIAIATYNND